MAEDPWAEFRLPAQRPTGAPVPPAPAGDGSQPLTFDVTPRRQPQADEWADFRLAPMGTGEAVLRGAERGASFGFGDEARGAWAASSLPTWAKAIFPVAGVIEGAARYVGGDEEAAKRYDTTVAENRQLQEQAEREHPWATMGGEVAGGIGSAIATAPLTAARAVGLGGRMLQGALAGGTAGGLYGAGTADAGLSERGIEAAKGAGIGAVAGPIAEGGLSAIRAGWARAFPRSTAAPSTLALEDASALSAIGLDPAQIGDDAARSITGRAQPYGGVSDATLRQAAADEFGIPLTRGQATRDVGQFAFEEEARAAARGDPAANIIRGFDTRQGEAIRGARERIQRDIAGPYTVRTDVGEIGEGITGAVRDAERALNNRVGLAYGRAGQTGATISADSVRALPQRMAAVLDDAAIIVDDKLTPATQAALRELSRVADVEGFAASRGVKLSPDASVAGVNLQGLEYIRRRINGLFGGNLSRADRNGLTTVKQEFDRWLDDAVENTLISGDERALDALKEARALRTEYGRKFEKADRFDDSGGLIQRILRQDVTPGEVANMLYGLNKVGEQGRSYRLAKDLREIMGPDSEGWSAIRQGAFARMTMAPEGTAQPSPKVIKERIVRFVNGPDGAAMARVLYSEEERQQMRRFANVVHLLTPEPRSANPSGSGFVGARHAQGVMTKLAAMLGFAGTGGNVGAAAAAAGAMRAGSAARNVTKAIQATQPVRIAPPSSLAPAVLSGELGTAQGLPMLPDFSRR